MQEQREDRRRDYRLASGASVEAVVVDAADRPVALLHDAQVLDVCAGGVAVMTDSDIDAGVELRIAVKPRLTLDREVRFKARVLHADRGRDGAHRLGCRLSAGRVPAALIYNW